MLLVVLKLRLAAKELSTHGKQYILGTQGIRRPRQITHRAASLTNDMEYNVLSLVVLGWHSVCGTSAEVDPLENFAWLVVVKLSWLIDLDVSRHFTDERLNVRNGSAEPPLDFFASPNELVHSSLCAGHFEFRILISVISCINFVAIILNILITQLSIQHLLLNALVFPSTSRRFEPDNLLRLLLGDDFPATIVDAHIKDHNEKHCMAIFLVVVDCPVQQVVYGFDVSL